MPVIHITEHRPATLRRDELTVEQGTILHGMCRDYLDLTFPSPATGDLWQLTFRGWAGAIRLDRETEIVITPKVPVGNLGRMLQYAYDLPVTTLPQLIGCTSVTELYEQLVLALAREAFKLARQGLHHEYQTKKRELAAVRGRIDVGRTIRRPASDRVICLTSDRTADIAHNQLLLAALEAALRSSLCTDGTQALVRQAYRQLGHGVSLPDIDRGSLARLTYSRLTERYRPAHALAILILRGQGVGGRGETAAVPFLVNMPNLYERFVARWLAKHLPNGFAVTEQQHWSVGTGSRVDFYIDILVRDVSTGRALCVLDTKYKDQSYPVSHDIAQVAYYALLEGCRLGGLVVPVDSGNRWEAQAGGVNTFRASFDLSTEIERSGGRFLSDLLNRIETLAMTDSRVTG